MQKKKKWKTITKNEIIDQDEKNWWWDIKLKCGEGRKKKWKGSKKLKVKEK